MKDLQTLVAASPSVIYTTTQSQGDYACPFVSENLTPIMGYLAVGDARRSELLGRSVSILRMPSASSRSSNG